MIVGKGGIHRIGEVVYTAVADGSPPAARLAEDRIA